MAIKILSEVTAPTGLRISNLIATLMGRYSLKYVDVDGVRQYEITSFIYYYFDRTKNQVFDEQLKLIIPASQLDSVFEVFYGFLKNKYPSYEDLL